MESMCICVRKITRHSISTQLRQSYSCKSLFVLLIITYFGTFIFQAALPTALLRPFWRNGEKKQWAKAAKAKCQNILVAYSKSTFDDLVFPVHLSEIEIFTKIIALFTL